MRPIIIGQAPARGMSQRPPILGTKTGDRLCELSGKTEYQMWKDFEFTNLLRRYPGKAHKGDAFPAGRARRAALRMIRDKRLDARKVILLGYGVAKAFGNAGMNPCEWYTWTLSADKDGLHHCDIAVLPHPSGINRWWNDDDNRLRAVKFLRSLP